MKITPGGVVAAEWTKFSSLRSTWITTGISVFLLVAFGMIAFAGGGMQAFDESVPLIAASLLMTVSWIIFQAQRPKTVILELEARLRVAKGLSH